MSYSSRRQSMPIFCVLSILFGGFMVAFGGYGLYQVLSMEHTNDVVFGIGFMVLMGLVLLITGICLTVSNYSSRKKIKADEEIQYKLVTTGRICDIKDANELVNAVSQLASGEELTVSITPACGGVTEWKFIKIKKQYISFPTIEKNGKSTQFFIMPKSDLNDATKMFVELMRDRKGVDKSELISMKKYKSVLAYYKLNV